MRVNAKGIDLIRRFEGCRLEAYRCSAGVATVGFGHTGPDVRMGMTITQERADELLEVDLRRFENGVTAMIGSAPTTEDQFAAMTSLAFNIGLGKFATSTVLKRHKLGNPVGAANAFLMWHFAKGKSLDGLMRRREAEKALYLGEVA